mgnify:FL=1
MKTIITHLSTQKTLLIYIRLILLYNSYRNYNYNKAAVSFHILEYLMSLDLLNGLAKLI